jgi:hypothetical protein
VECDILDAGGPHVAVMVGRRAGGKGRVFAGFRMMLQWSSGCEVHQA